MYKAQN